MGKVWRSNSNLGSHLFLKNVFLTCRESKCLEMHAQAIIHPWISFSPILMEFWLSHATRRWLSSLSPSRFDVVSSLLNAQNSFYVLLGKWEEMSHDSGVWEGRFCHCEQDGIFPQVFLHFFYFLQAGKPVFGLPTNWRRNPQFLGGCWVCFFPRETHRSFWKLNCCQRDVFPFFTGSFLVASSVSGNAQRMEE